MRILEAFVDFNREDYVRSVCPHPALTHHSCFLCLQSFVLEYMPDVGVKTNYPGRYKYVHVAVYVCMPCAFNSTSDVQLCMGLLHRCTCCRYCIRCPTGHVVVKMYELALTCMHNSMHCMTPTRSPSSGLVMHNWNISLSTPAQVGER